MMLKKNATHPIEVALEKSITEIGKAIAWSLRVITKFFFVIPKNKYDKAYKKMELLGIFLIAIGWILVTFSRYHFFGF